MSNLFFVSDTHFNHANILTFTNFDGSKVRPFTSLVEMNETLVSNWNKKVGKNDTVWHLGDVFFGKESEGLAFVRRLNGRINLILGNHDHVTPAFLAAFNEIHSWQKWKKHSMFLSHFPLHGQTMDEMFTDGHVVNVHGHIHGAKSPLAKMGMKKNHSWINISVENTNYEPLSFEELNEKIKKEG